MINSIPIRPRRNRINSSMRSLVQENQLTVNDRGTLVIEGEQKQIEVPSMPGIYRTLDKLVEEVKRLWKLGIKAVALFPAIDEDLKDSVAGESHLVFQRLLELSKSAAQKCSRYVM